MSNRQFRVHAFNPMFYQGSAWLQCPKCSVQGRGRWKASSDTCVALFYSLVRNLMSQFPYFLWLWRALDTPVITVF
jgi:hypothetical protein